jgi:dTDP-4-amino-4,6-dideoxygalactose transaminase
MQIPLVDLHIQYRYIKQEVMEAISDVLDDMQLVLGPQCRAFEAEFASYCGCQYGIGVSTGTDALILALRAGNVKPGDEVITVAHTFIATVEAISAVGAVPVFVDIEPDTYTLDCQQLEQAFTPRTRALLPVHLYGHPADMQPLLTFAQHHGLWVIEDASQAHGATYHHQRVGSLGDIAAFSLYCSKNLGAYGDAGICVTNNEILAERLRLLRNHGSHIRYQHEALGFNARLDELQAAVLRVKLKHLDAWNRARQEHAHFYTEHLVGLVEQLPVVQPECEHTYHLYVVQVQARDQFCEALEQEGIATGIHYPLPVHLQPACAHYGYQPGSIPLTEVIAAKIVSLPMYPELTTQQLEHIINTVRKHSIAEGAQAF